MKFGKLKKIFFVFALILFFGVPSYATTLPINIMKFLKSNDSGVQVRFDGLISYPDGSVYLPLFPSLDEKVDKISVIYTYPKNVDYKKRPSIIIFNSNFAMLKLLKAQDSKLTVSNPLEMPIIVKTALLPQDLLVPKGLVLPEILNGILGNLVIPLKDNIQLERENTTLITTKSKSSQKLHNKIVQKPSLNPIDAIKNKLYFVTNYNSSRISVYTSNSPEALYYLKLDSIPKDIKAIHDNNILLVATSNRTYLDVVDVKKEEVIKQIDLAIEPNQILISTKNNKIYVISTKERTIFVMDLAELKLKEMIKVKGEPQKVILSADESELFYVDRQTSDIYNLKFVQDEKPINEMVLNVQNISKMSVTKDNLYTIVRTKDIVIPYELSTKLTAEPVLVAQKPVDMLLYKDKLFILGAKNSEISIFDTKTNAVGKTVNIDIKGFCSHIVQINDTNKAIITSANAEKYAIIDLDEQKVLQILPIDSPISSIIIFDKDKIDKL